MQSAEDRKGCVSSKFIDGNAAAEDDTSWLAYLLLHQRLFRCLDRILQAPFPGLRCKAAFLSLKNHIFLPELASTLMMFGPETELKKS